MNFPTVENVLVGSRKALSDRVKAIDHDFKSGRDADSGERATELENEAVLVELRREASEELAQIDQALLRLKEGEYGTCLSCGKEINHDRLKVVPYAIECINCAK